MYTNLLLAGWFGVRRGRNEVARSHRSAEEVSVPEPCGVSVADPQDMDRSHRLSGYGLVKVCWGRVGDVGVRVGAVFPVGLEMGIDTPCACVWLYDGVGASS